MRLRWWIELIWFNPGRRKRRSVKEKDVEPKVEADATKEESKEEAFAPQKMAWEDRWRYRVY